MTFPPPLPNSLGSALEWAIAGVGFPEEGVRMFAPEKHHSNPAQIEAEKETGR